MRRSILTGLFLASLIVAAWAADDTAVDKTTQQIAQLEAQLGKLRSSTPEAAAVMVQLVDQYYNTGRVHGLIRTGQDFVAQHSAHPQHKAVMLKLLDGLKTAGRTKEIVATARQFLAKYPQTPEAAGVEELLARTLTRSPDRQATAETYESVWRRLGPTPDGRRYAASAVYLYYAIAGKDGYTRSAQLAEQVVEKLPVGEFAIQVGHHGLHAWEQLGEWAKANLAAAKLIAKMPPTDKDRLRALHYRMGENSSRLGQRANALDSFRKAMALGEGADVQYRLISELNAAGAKGEDLEPEVVKFVQKYPNHPYRHSVRALLAHAWMRDPKQHAKAIQIFTELLPVDARSHETAQHYVRLVANTPAGQAQAEAALKAALTTNKNDASILRYALCLELYRDRMKDLAKAKQTARELLTQGPNNDGFTTGVILFLFQTAANDAEFKSDFGLVMAARKAHLNWGQLREYPQAWITEANKAKETKDRASWAVGELGKANQDPLYKLWLQYDSQDRNQAINARTALAAPDLVKTLPDDQAYQVLWQLGYDHRQDAHPQNRTKATPVYAQLVQRFPTNYQAATAWLESATEYGQPEQAKLAAQHIVKVTPEANTADIARRLLSAADAAKDTELVKQGWAWTVKSWEKFQLYPSYIYIYGDVLERHGMKAEALDLWKRGLTIDRNNYDSRACAERLLQRMKPAERAPFLQELIKADTVFQGTYSEYLADDQVRAKDYAGFEATIKASRDRAAERPYQGWGIEDHIAQPWVDVIRADKDGPVPPRKSALTLLRDCYIGRPSASAALAVLEMTPPAEMKPMQRLLACYEATMLASDAAHTWDTLMTYAQAMMARKEYVEVAALASDMLANIPSVDPGRRKAALDMVRQSYARMGGLGLTVDESSPLAPLFQAALYLRLGDERLAFETYSAHQKLFDEHRHEIPVDLVLFVCENLAAAGGDQNFNRAEDVLRGWLVKNSEVKEIEDSVKARVQLLLARTYFRAQRYDVARSEFSTVMNRYPKTQQAIEAEFGIGESFMAQKVYDQAQVVFEKLANSTDRDIVIRAEFLRGVLAYRKGDRDEARTIFRGVLERVPSVELANQALYNLAEVYGAEQRYIDQLELLRTVGRLGRASKRWHTPGLPLSIVVQDSDLGISRGHTRIPVKVTTVPGGDEETIYLHSGGAGKGLFRADLDTRLGKVTKNDRVLQLTGRDTIKVDYPEEFKKEFRNVPLSDAEIRVASNAKLEIGNSKITDEEGESFSQRLEREARDQDGEDKRVSQGRPRDQVKPGNPIYLRVKDADRDLSDEPDKVSVKLTATSGDQVQVDLIETGPHTGIFEAMVKTGELPAGALASDSSIDHGPLMAIDKDRKSFWLSQPDGATPKWLSVDLKDLRKVDSVTITTPDPMQRAPVRGTLEGSNDGRFWFRLGGNPMPAPADPVVIEAEHMSRTVYSGQFGNINTWAQVVALSKNGKPIDHVDVDEIAWALSEKEAKEPNAANKPFAAIWHGKLVQQRAGSARIHVRGTTTALALDGQVELPPGPGDRSVDIWLDEGTHDLTIFAAGTGVNQGLGATWTRSDHNAKEVVLVPFRSTDFDLKQSGLKPAKPRKPAEVNADKGTWTFHFAPISLRHVRLVIQEYRGEAVAISNVEVQSLEDGKVYIPTETDVLSLATNDVLELAAGDKVTANYVDEFTESATGGSRLLTAELEATYFNGVIQPIAYDFQRLPNGQIINLRKLLMRIDPGERLIVEVTDFDQDRTDQPDSVKIQVAVNNGEPLDLVAKETGNFTGIFTKEVDTSDKPEKGKLTVKPGDRIHCRYLDAQNTFPGHSVVREAVVYVSEPTEAKMRIVETRYVRPPQDRTDIQPQLIYLPPRDAGKEPKISNIAFEVPLTIEVYDKDAAKDSKSTVTVVLTTAGGAKVDVDCVVSNAFAKIADPNNDLQVALDEGRFIGQVILQLGSKNSPDLVPLTANMPRNLVGGAKLTKEESNPNEKTLVTRVLNVNGKDQITATYKDERRPKGEAKEIAAQGRLIANGTLACTDAEYKVPVKQLHVGERLYLMVTDADLDKTDERDKALVEISTKRGEKEVVELVETLAHSGIFTGSVALKATEKPTPGNISPDNPAIECYFGDTLLIKYTDEAASTETGILVVELEVPVVVGTDGLVSAFSKTFNDESLAVETQFHIAESYFELFKSHKTLKRVDEQKSDLEAGRRVLREVMEDYPNPKYVPRIAYLLGQFAQELQQWREAIESYQMIVRQHADHPLAPEAQYKLAQCYEEAGDFEQALESYVTLAATYPKSPLIANVMLRISEHFYRTENFKVAAQVGEKFLERFEGHKWAPKMAFRVGQCYYKDKKYGKAGEAFDRFAKTFPEDALSSDSLFWSGESFRMANNNKEAFVRYNKCRWDFPSSEAAKYARGRLALPEMLQQFENAANLENNQ
jgi:TolA-binding protein